MPVILEDINQKLKICSKCQELTNHGVDAMPGYSYGCKLLKDSAFNMIPNEIVENNSVFPDCPKLNGTIFEGNRYQHLKK